MSFVHLHTHTEYSMLDGSNKVSEYVKAVKELGMNAAAITDHGVMFGCIDFYKTAKAAGIKPIIGCEVYVAPDSRFDKEKADERYFHLILLAQNDLGYHNLMKIVSIGFTEGFYYKPRVDFETLEKYHEGIICLSACMAGEVASYLRKSEYENAKQVALRYEACFGKGNYFLEMQDHGIPMQKNINVHLIEIYKETGIELVATNDCHYTYAEDAGPHDVLLCIQTEKTVDDPDRMKYEGGQFYVKSEQEMRALFAATPQAIENTQKIADRCNVEIEIHPEKPKIPKFDVPEGYDARSYLRKLCDEGIEKRYPREVAEKNEKYQEIITRLNYELDTIDSMGFTDYFLIVWDFINYAKTNDIPVGPGRGSAAGSIVSYAIGITDIDPIRYQLLFERFLNPERVSMPDVDVDFCYERRGEVIDYVVRKYGKDCVSQIVTYDRLKARAAVRNVGKALGLSYGYVDKIAKSIPRELDITLEKAINSKKDKTLRTLYDTDSTVHGLIDTSMKLEGLPRHIGRHAAGVVITQFPIGEYVPLATSEGAVVTQFPMTTVEELGLLKMDFLGLRTLTIIKDCVRLVSQNKGIDIDIDAIDYDDKAVYEMISAGKTDGVFQLESAGMKSFMKELKPENIEDIIAGVALYRPGPMDFIPKYIKGKRDKEQIVYECPQLEPILSATYGCIVYQEQVMQIVRSLAGYTMGRSDILRRAMSKKKGDVMEKERVSFVFGNKDEGVPGCIANGIPEEVANHIYDEMIDFAKYAFNKSHAACYAVVAYQTAYLKTYYPQEFFAAMMSAVSDDIENITKYTLTCRDMGIDVLPPDINYGEGRFSVEDNNIRFGLYAIKSVGHGVIDAIIEDRKNLGPYKTIEEFLERASGIKDSALNKRAVESLIKAGALDGLKGNRRQKMMIYPLLMDDVSKASKNRLAGQISLIDIADDNEKSHFRRNMPQVEEYPKEELLSYEKEVLGVYASGHPLEDYIDIIQKNITATSDMFALDEDEDSETLKDKQEATLGGIINKITIKYTKKDEPMAFLELEDLSGVVEIIVFPRAYSQYKSSLEEGNKVFIKGKVSLESERDGKLMADSIVPFNEIPQNIWIQFASKEDYNNRSEELDELISSTPGKDLVTIYLKDSKMKKTLSKRFDGSPVMIDELIDRYGEENIRCMIVKI